MRVQCLDARRVGSEEDISLQAGRQVAVAVQVARQAVVVQILQSLPTTFIRFCTFASLHHYRTLHRNNSFPTDTEISFFILS